MLHHVASPALQDRLFAEVYRVLRPGGAFAGIDSMRSVLMRIFHIRDTMVLVIQQHYLPDLRQSASRT